MWLRKKKIIDCVIFPVVIINEILLLSPTLHVCTLRLLIHQAKQQNIHSGIQENYQNQLINYPRKLPCNKKKEETWKHVTQHANRKIIMGKGELRYCRIQYLGFSLTTTIK